MTAPEFVSVVRSIIPKEGRRIGNSTQSRIKSRIKKALTKAGIDSTTIRGVGQKVGDYAIVYELTSEDILYAKFEEYASLPAPTKSKRGSRGKSKKSPLLTGINPLVSDLTKREFTLRVLEALPKEWKKQSPDAYRWISFDMDLLFNTQHTVQTAANHIIEGTEAMLSGREVNYTFMEINDHYLIGVGPS